MKISSKFSTQIFDDQIILVDLLKNKATKYVEIRKKCVKQSNGENIYKMLYKNRNSDPDKAFDLFSNKISEIKKH